MKNKTYRLLLVFFILALFLIQCAGVKTTGTFNKLNNKEFDNSTKEFVGVPYVWGGTSKQGVDCSGFTSSVYKDQGILLPRTSKEQYTIGKTVPQTGLKKGDLMFFNTFGRGVSHVGIYVDDHRMIHASSSDGVKYTKYNTNYWQRKYIGSKRIVGSPYISGEKKNENIAVISEFPMRITNLINIPTALTLDRRHFSLDFSTNIAGNLLVNSSIGFWNRLEFGTSLVFNEVLSDQVVGVEIPRFYSKFRFWNEGVWYPSAAIGYSNTRLSETREDTLSNLVQKWSEPRGLYSVFGKTVFEGWKWLLGTGKTYIGVGTTHVIKNLELENLYMFAAYEQQIIKKIILIAEIDDIFRSGKINAGMRIALTSSTSIEFSFMNLFEDDINPDRALRFTYFLTY